MDAPSQEDIQPRAFKVILVGPQAVGKSSILNRLAQTKFNNNYMPTIGIDFKTYDIPIGNKIYALQIWDTAGQQKFRALTSSYYKGSNGCICVFDLHDLQSLEKCQYYVEKAMGEGIPNQCILIIGNKADLGIQNQGLGQKFASKFKIQYKSVSAKEGKGLNQAVKNLAAHIIEKGINLPNENIRIRPTLHIAENRSKCSC